MLRKINGHSSYLWPNSKALPIQYLHIADSPAESSPSTPPIGSLEFFPESYRGPGAQRWLQVAARDHHAPMFQQMLAFVQAPMVEALTKSERWQNTHALNIVALGCSDLAGEWNVVHGLAQMRPVHLYLVDIDEEMVRTASERLDFIDFASVTAITADFHSEAFHSYLSRLQRGDHLTLHLVFGFTLGNLRPEIAQNWLAKVMQPGDLMWCDLSVRTPDMDAEKLETTTAQVLDKSPAVHDFLVGPLRDRGVAESTGQLRYKAHSGEIPGSMFVEFHYAFQENVTISEANQPTVHKANS
ncbi:MAG: hypothetical protein AAF570_13795, partial [Bacteroidota bacterium]